MIGLSTYAFFWRHSELAPEPLSLPQMLERTAAEGVGVFQICDYPGVEVMSTAELERLADTARQLGIQLELGTRGVSPDNLATYLRLAVALEATLVRSMLLSPTVGPSLAESEGQLRESMGAYDDEGITIALETYEQVTSTDLVSVIESIGNDQLGICLDPANSVAALENPRDVIDRTAPYVKNIHVKDFAFTRRGGWVGFTLEGAPLGDGLLDYRYLLDAVRPKESGISQILEHWLPLHDTIEQTMSIERDWTTHNLNYLRSM